MHDRFHWNVMSGRYSEMPTRKWCPTAKDVRAQGQGNKQVANGQMEEQVQQDVSRIIQDSNTCASNYYETLLEKGVGREQARTVLPMGQYTEAYVTANLGDWLLFLRQRMDPHAQREIQVYAEAIYKILCDLFPATMNAFSDYQMNSTRFSAQEMQALKAMLDGELGCVGTMGEKPAEGNWHPVAEAEEGTIYVSPATPANLAPAGRKIFLEKHLPTKRERVEFWKKIQ